MKVPEIGMPPLQRIVRLQVLKQLPRVVYIGHDGSLTFDIGVRFSASRLMDVLGLVFIFFLKHSLPHTKSGAWVFFQKIHASTGRIHRYCSADDLEMQDVEVEESLRPTKQKMDPKKEREQ